MLSFVEQHASQCNVLQLYLKWILDRSGSIELPLPRAFIRAVYWSIGFCGSGLAPQAHDVGIVKFRAGDSAQSLNLDLARAVDSYEATFLPVEIDAAREHERGFDRDLEIAAQRRSVSSKQLAQMVNDEGVMASKSTWVEQLRADLDSAAIGHSPKIKDVSDIRRVEEYELRTTLLLQCLRVSRVTRRCFDTILNSILLPPSRS